MGRAAGIPPHPPAARKPGASASGAALPAGAQRAALPGQLTLRVPAQEAPHARPSLPGACPSWVLSGRGRGQVGQRSLSGKGGSRTSPLALRPHGEALSVAGSGGLVSLLSDPRPREGPETQKSPLLVPFPHLTPGSQDTLSGIEPPTLDPGVRGGPRAPRAASVRPAPGEEPAGSWPCGQGRSRRVCSAILGFLSSGAGSRPSLRPLLPGSSRRLTRLARLPFQSGPAGAARLAAQAVGPVSATSSQVRSPSRARRSRRGRNSWLVTAKPTGSKS